MRRLLCTCCPCCFSREGGRHAIDIGDGDLDGEFSNVSLSLLEVGDVLNLGDPGSTRSFEEEEGLATSNGSYAGLEFAPSSNPPFAYTYPL